MYSGQFGVDFSWKSFFSFGRKLVKNIDNLVPGDEYFVWKRVFGSTDAKTQMGGLLTTSNRT